MWAESDSQAGWGKGIVKSPKSGEKIPNVLFKHELGALEINSIFVTGL